MQAWEEKILERREGREEGFAAGLKRGQRNEKRRITEIAKGFKESNIPIDIIAKNTGLTKEEIEAL